MEALTEEQQRSLAQSLTEAKRQVEGEIDRFCRRYADNNKLTYADAQKALSQRVAGLPGPSGGF